MTFTADPKPFTLQEKSLHFWRFSLDSTYSENTLNEEEKARANRYYFEKHRLRFTAARAGIREILGQYLNIAPQDVVFHTNSHGKPEIHANLHFNLSHSGDKALLGICKDYPLGVDIETYSERSYLGIANNAFSPQEITALKAVPLSFRPALFFRIWSQKEAFIKACGLGLSYPLQQFSVPTQGEVPSLIEDTLHEQFWKIQHFMYDIAISGAFCCHPDINHFYMNTYHAKFSSTECSRYL